MFAVLLAIGVVLLSTTGMPVPEDFAKVFGICGIDCAQRIRLRLIFALRAGTGGELIGCHTRRSVAG